MIIPVLEEGKFQLDIKIKFDKIPDRADISICPFESGPSR